MSTAKHEEAVSEYGTRNQRVDCPPKVSRISEFRLSETKFCEPGFSHTRPNSRIWISNRAMAGALLRRDRSNLTTLSPTMTVKLHSSIIALGVLSFASAIAQQDAPARQRTNTGKRKHPEFVCLCFRCSSVAMARFAGLSHRLGRWSMRGPQQPSLCVSATPFLFVIPLPPSSLLLWIDGCA